jgi:hypothetical protein
MIFPSKKSGYTLLFAVLVATLVLGVAVFITGIARKQYILSSTALDSLYALYAADSGIQCATAGGVPSSPGPVVIKCTNNLFPLPTYSSGITNFSLGFYTQTTTPSPIGCAVINIDTSYATIPGDPRKATVLSKGYNLCKILPGGGYGPDDSSPRTVERALQVDYLK